MNTFFALLLIIHVITGVVGAIVSHNVYVNLIKKEVNTLLAYKLSLAAFMLYLVSWLTAGVYYLLYYGSAVKPVILKSYPWAHSFAMELKEHIFLFLPFLSLMVCTILHEKLETEELNAIKKPLVYLAATVTALAVAVALLGILVSGAVRTR